MSSGHGEDTEDYIEELCQKMFLRDFTVKSPKYYKRGKEKEASDILILFSNYVFNFQIKSKVENKPFLEKTETDLQRIQKKIDEAIGQLKALGKADKLPDFNEVTTTQGIKLSFSLSNHDQRVGIIVLNLEGEEVFPEDEQTRLQMSYQEKHGYQIHIFMKSIFNLISEEIDTIPDFINYLETRKTFLKGGTLLLGNELDFLATYKYEYPIIEQILKQPASKLYIEEGKWNNCQADHEETLKQRVLDNQPSFLIDKLIENLNSSIGFKVEGDHLLISEGTVEHYLKIITYLSSLNRLERRGLGEKWLEKAIKAQTSPHGVNYCASLYPELDLGTLVVCTRERNRDRRITLLENLTRFAAVHYETVSSFLGIVTEELNQGGSSYDCVLMEEFDISNVPNLAEEKEKAAKFFQEVKYGEINEFRGGS